MVIDEEATNEELIEGIRHLANGFSDAVVHADTRFEQEKLLRAAAMLRFVATRNEFSTADHIELTAWYEAGRITIMRFMEEERAARRLERVGGNK